MAIHELRVALTVADYEQAVSFYRDTLGLPELEVWESPQGRVTLLGGGRATLEILEEGHAAEVDEIEVVRRVAGPFRLALELDDSAGIAERLVEVGGTL